MPADRWRSGIGSASVPFPVSAVHGGIAGHRASTDPVSPVVRKLLRIDVLQVPVEALFVAAFVVSPARSLELGRVHLDPPVDRSAPWSRLGRYIREEVVRIRQRDVEERARRADVLPPRAVLRRHRSPCPIPSRPGGHCLQAPGTASGPRVSRRRRWTRCRSGGCGTLVDPGLRYRTSTPPRPSAGRLRRARRGSSRCRPARYAPRCPGTPPSSRRRRLPCSM